MKNTITPDLARIFLFEAAKAHRFTLHNHPVTNGDRILDYDIKKQDFETVEPVTDTEVQTALRRGTPDAYGEKIESQP